MLSINKVAVMVIGGTFFFTPFNIYADTGDTSSTQNRFKNTSVQIGGLPELGTNSLGIETGLPLTLWKGADVSKIAPKILKLAESTLTPSMQDLFIRLMMTNTDGHQGLPIEKRLQALGHVGAWDDIIRLTDLVPPTKQTADIRKQKIEALFLSGKIHEAHKLIQTFPSSDWKNQMHLACAVAAGDKTGAELIFATGLETNDWDELTNVLGKKLLQNRTIQWPKKIILKSHHIHMAAALGKDFPWEKTDLSFPIKKALAQLETPPIDKRILWAEETLQPDAVAKLYQTAPKDKRTPRSKLFQDIASEKNPEKQIALINNYLDKTRQDGLFVRLAPIVLPFLNTIPADTNRADLGFNAAQVYALTNNLDLAFAWVKVLEKSDSQTHKNQSIMLAPLMQTMGAGYNVKADSVLHNCEQEQTPFCHHFLSQSEANILTDNIEILFGINWKNKNIYPPIITSFLTQKTTDGALGEALIYTLLALQHSPTFEPYLIKALKNFQPFYFVRPLIIERHLYQ